MLLRRKPLVLLATAMLLVMMAMPGAALAVPPQQNEHNCYGATTSYYGAEVHAFRNPQNVGLPYNHYGPLVRDIAHSYPGAVGAGQRDLREALANCGANR